MNPYAAPPLCDICLDSREVQTKHHGTEKCQRCGCTDPDPEKGHRRTKDCGGCRWRRAAYIDRLKAHPSDVRPADLTEKEMALWDRWSAEGYNPLDGLRWVEGQRYDPSKDEEFLTDAREKFRQWRRDAVDRHEGLEPEWLLRALKGEKVEMNSSQKEFLKLWKEKTNV